jgi:hypothetical protein
MWQWKSPKITLISELVKYGYKSVRIYLSDISADVSELFFNLCRIFVAQHLFNPYDTNWFCRNLWP